MQENKKFRLHFLRAPKAAWNKIYWNFCNTNVLMISYIPTSSRCTHVRKKQTLSGLRDGLSWVTTLQSGWTGLFFSCTLYQGLGCTPFHIHSPFLTFFLCFIVLFQSCCPHAQVFGKTLVHEFPIFCTHTEWNLFASGTNTPLWWRACFKKLNYKQTNKDIVWELAPGSEVRPCFGEHRDYTPLLYKPR